MGKDAGLKLRITIGGNTYEADVEVLEEEDSAAAAPATVYALPANHAHSGDEEQRGGIADKTCRSPVTGMVIRVQAEAGRAVEAGEVLVVLEAMKMETPLTSPYDATVRAVHVAEGDRVAGGTVLVELEE
jgi:methylmalonyl-CoA carboxyltransferase 1.3S subunit